ncbi:MAG: aldolase/citrate lyase family protein, partial [Rhodospirillales bacterium]|jgi:2-keto-3-deoxy-L-rhamnonate aldolase RhmA|nr:aldolase/citrate lyase family protein [Rhodospirillales bacterium]
VRLSRSGDIAKGARTSGHDFLFIDLQHGVMSLDTATEICLVASGCGVAPLVRVTGFDNPEAARLLDCGAMGIIVPDVNTAEDARKAVATCKFPPIGRRSVFASYPHFDFAAVPVAEAAPAMNEGQLLVCMVESPEGIANLDAIAAVDGVDVIHMGCNDLLYNMGLPGQFGHPDVIAAIDRLIASCAKHGKFAGVGGDRDPARQADYIRKGVRFMTTQSDLAMLMAEASRRTKFLRELR